MHIVNKFRYNVFRESIRTTFPAPKPRCNNLSLQIFVRLPRTSICDTITSTGNEMYAKQKFQLIKNMKFYLPNGKQKKNGNQQIIKTPTTIPSVFAAFFSLLNLAIFPANVDLDFVEPSKLTS